MIKRHAINMIWLDDMRDAGEPEWTRVKTVSEAIEHLEMRDVQVISLDYDLGAQKDATGHIETGLDVLKWIEELVVSDPTYVQPIMRIHTNDQEALIEMKAIAKRINGITASRRLH